MNPEHIRATFEARQNAVSELRALADEIGANEPTAEQRAKEVRLHETIDTASERIEEGLRALEADKAAEESRSRLDALTETRTEGTAPGGTSDRDVLGALLRGERRSAEFAPTEVRDLTTGGAAGESNLIPDTLYGQLHEYLRETSTVVAANSRVIRTSGGEVMRFPKVTAYSTAQIVGEAAPIPNSDPNFDRISLNAYKYGVLLRMSHEMMADPAFDLIGFLARQAGVSMGHGIGTHLLVGDGTGKPNGVVTAATKSKVLAAAGTITGDELIDLMHTVASPYRKNAAWLFEDTTVASIRKLKDSNGQYLWQPGLQAGEPDRILGKPVFTDPSMASGSTLSAKIGLFGDMQSYITRFSGSLRIERSDDFAFDTDETVWRVLQRADGDLIDPNGVATLDNPAA